MIIATLSTVVSSVISLQYFLFTKITREVSGKRSPVSLSQVNPKVLWIPSVSYSFSADLLDLLDLAGHDNPKGFNLCHNSMHLVKEKADQFCRIFVFSNFCN